MQIAILQISPFGQENELQLAIRKAGMEPILLSMAGSLEQLAAISGLILIGDLLEDDLSYDLLIPLLKLHNEQGKPILGLGAGARVLVESGIVPGLENYQVGITFTMMQNTEVAFTNQYMRLAEEYQRNAFTRYLTPHTVITVTSSPCSASFFVPPGLLMELEIQGLNVFQYCEPNAIIIKPIAAISNKVGNVMAMIPIPSFSYLENVFQSMRDYITDGIVPQVAPLHYFSRHCQKDPKMPR